MGATALATEQLLVPQTQLWGYYQPNADPATTYANFNTGTGSWFAKESDFVSATGYQTLVGKGFGIDGAKSYGVDGYDGGSAAGPFAYGGVDAIPGVANLTAPASGARNAAYFRTTFTLAQPFVRPRLRGVFDDGALVYLDGELVARINQTTAEGWGTLASDTTATNNETGASAGNETVTQTLALYTANGAVDGILKADCTIMKLVPNLAAGTHTIAISLRSNALTSSDLGFSFEVYGDDSAISATAGAGVRDAQGTADLIDDTFTVPVTVSKIGSPSTSWTSDGTVASGNYDTPYNFGPYSAANTPLINFTSVGNPGVELTSSLTVAAPFWGGVNLVSTPISGITFSTAAAQWAQQVPTGTLQQNNGGTAGAPHVAQSDTIALTPGADKVLSLDFEYEDASTGSNAEVIDHLKIELVTNVGTFDLTASLDLNGDGFVNGYTTDAAAIPPRPDAYDVVPLEDEFNPDGHLGAIKYIQTWKVAGVIPGAASSASFRISGVNDSGSEFLRVRNILVRPAVDTDNDGALDAQEEIVGTNPASAASRFFIKSVGYDAGVMFINVPTVLGRSYTVERSNDLVHWYRDSAPTPGTDTDVELLSISPDDRRYVRIRVTIPSVIVP